MASWAPSNEPSSSFVSQPPTPALLITMVTSPAASAAAATCSWSVTSSRNGVTSVSVTLSGSRTAA